MDKVKVFTDIKEEFQALTIEDSEKFSGLLLKLVTCTTKLVENSSFYMMEFLEICSEPIEFTMDTPFYLIEDAFNGRKRAAIRALDMIIESIIFDKSFDTGANERSNIKLLNNDYSKVFIVHGHDDGAKNEVARFVERLGFEAKILHEQVDSGATIIEKLEKHTDVGFAIVLYTACDIGGVINSKLEDLKSRARQNVIFEHGLLIGKIGRANVVALVKGDVEIECEIFDNCHCIYMKLLEKTSFLFY